MEQSFEDLIDSFIENKVGISDNFLSVLLSNQLKSNLQKLYDINQLKPAGTGNETIILKDKLIRSDKIYWLDRIHNDPHENAFFDLMDHFVLYLNSTCYTGITGYEFHYAMYEKGAFYKKHLDQFKNNESRQFSMIMYLNTDWIKSDGGELCIYHKYHEQHISPNEGKSVFFRSNELEHEVLITNKIRMSITGWLKKD